jgi:hypothetical protein
MGGVLVLWHKAWASATESAWQRKRCRDYGRISKTRISEVVDEPGVWTQLMLELIGCEGQTGCHKSGDRARRTESNREVETRIFRYCSAGLAHLLAELETGLPPLAERVDILSCPIVC